MEEDNNLTLSILIKESGEYDELASSSDDESKGNNYTIDVMIKRIKSLSLTEMMKQLKYIGVYNYEFKSIEEFEGKYKSTN
ncbi:hypothetical protein RclHR1_01490024 [Rhizophagus clarus]|uniref:Uncharacterized protein n=1 Tax=Rhizophagus clarus TaxID=94130 RepID=A0A2Z6QDT7_9GLOM|nr:hypothetical protein RclHR1_01490024 [Rhizophagus clarus]